MFRKFAFAAILASFVAGAVSAQTPSTSPTSVAPAAANPAAKPASKKPAPKPKTAAKPPAVVETGPCRLGVISAVGNRIVVLKTGVTVFETEETEVPVEWGLDDLIVDRIRAATGGDPTVRRIAYPKGAFEMFYHPTSRFLPDQRESLQAIVRSFTPNAGCARYLVVTRFKGQMPGTNITLDGIGIHDRGLGSIIRHTRLFASISITLLDGATYERINRRFANFGARLASSLFGDDDITKVDNSLFPQPAAAAAGSQVLRERIRALVASNMDQALPAYLKDE